MAADLRRSATADLPVRPSAIADHGWPRGRGRTAAPAFDGVVVAGKIVRPRSTQRRQARAWHGSTGTGELSRSSAARPTPPPGRHGCWRWSARSCRASSRSRRRSCAASSPGMLCSARELVSPRRPDGSPRAASDAPRVAPTSALPRTDDDTDSPVDPKTAPGLPEPDRRGQRGRGDHRRRVPSARHRPVAFRSAAASADAPQSLSGCVRSAA